MRDLGGFGEPGIKGLAFGGQAVIESEALRQLREHDDPPDFASFDDADRAPQDQSLLR
ncbi:hypothetical protein D3C83_183530 [compost metagenome]